MTREDNSLLFDYIQSVHRSDEDFLSFCLFSDIRPRILLFHTVFTSVPDLEAVSGSLGYARAWEAFGLGTQCPATAMFRVVVFTETFKDIDIDCWNSNSLHFDAAMEAAKQASVRAWSLPPSLCPGPLPTSSFFKSMFYFYINSFSALCSRRPLNFDYEELFGLLFALPWLCPRRSLFEIWTIFCTVNLSFLGGDLVRASTALMTLSLGSSDKLWR